MSDRPFVLVPNAEVFYHCAGEAKVMTGILPGEQPIEVTEYECEINVRLWLDGTYTVQQFFYIWTEDMRIFSCMGKSATCESLEEALEYRDLWFSEDNGETIDA